MNWLKKIARGTLKATTEIGKTALNQIEQAKKLSMEWENKDKAFIHDKYKNGTTIEKMAATKVAKEKGWKS